MADLEARQWWRSGVLYQIYPRSFADANGDGIGDLEGILSKLDYLEWLGICGIWLSPISPSPNFDWGYDVSNYIGVTSVFGDLQSLDTLIGDARRRGIAVLLDLVPNHTSSDHPWFEASRKSRDSNYRDYYVWRDPSKSGGLPNNWLAQFGGQAWTFDNETGQYYLHNFTDKQPDLNWWNEEVRREFDEILRFWWDRGIAGFRIDVCNMVIKDKELRDNPPSDETDSIVEQIFGQRYLYNANRPEVHQVIKRWRQVANSYSPPKLLIGETDVPNIEALASFYGTDDELQLAFNFEFTHAPFEAHVLKGIVESTEATLPPNAWPTWAASNHDVSRMATRWAGGNLTKMRCALLILLTLRGTPVLYQGDEIGLLDGEIEKADLKDPVGHMYWPAMKGRDPERTPMPWDETFPYRGFGKSPSSARGEPKEPWLPISAPLGCSVAAQKTDPFSLLHFTRFLVDTRNKSLDLISLDYESIKLRDLTASGLWAYRRGSNTFVIINLGEKKESVSLSQLTYRITPGQGEKMCWKVLISTDPNHTFLGSKEIQLVPYSGVLLETER